MWTVTSSRVILQDRWISVRAERCVTASGHVIEPYYTLAYPDFVHVLAITGDNEIVLTRQYRHGYRGYSLELPGGTMDEDETSPLATGLRELEEETGYRVVGAELLPPLSPEPAKFTNRTHLVIGRDATPNGCRTPDPSEEIEVVLVSPAHLVALVAAGEIANLAHVGLVMIGLLRMGLLAAPVSSAD